MKRLFLLRHAKSSWDHPGLADFDRPLNARGRGAAEAVGREMRMRAIAPEAIVASPAVRVVQTLERVEAGFGRKLDVRFDRRIYAASAEQLLAILRETDERAASLMLVGHNPGFQSLVADLALDDPEGLRSSAAANFPTAALAEVVLDVERWRGAVRGSGRIAALIRPRDLPGLKR